MDSHMYLAVAYVVGVQLLNSGHGYPVDLHSSAPEDEGAGAWRGSSAWPLLLGCGSLLSSALLLAACLCCRRSSKGFQEFTDSTSTHSLHEAGSGSGSSESAGMVNSAATNGGTGVAEVTLFPPPVATNRSSVVSFDPLPDIKSPVSSVAPVAAATATSTPASSCRPAAFSSALSHGLNAHDWFENPHDNFPRSHLKYVKELGHGWFGRAVEGEAFGITPGQDTTRVVVKILHEDATATDHMFFLHEVRPYRDLNHPNVLRLLGRCLETDPFLIVLEACTSGDLKSFLSQNISTADALSQQGVTLSMCNQVAAGLLFMHQHGFVHTDLAARNCLVTSDLTVKIGDYGTSIDTFKEDYYCTSDVALPIRWCAPESLLCTDTTIETKEVTTSANVWSLGVVFWETCEFGKLPYEELTDEEVIVKVLVESSQYLSFPSRTSPFQHNLYRLMKSCWSPVSERPYLPQVLAMLNHLYENFKSFNEDGGSGNLERNVDFEKRWESLKPNYIPITDNHIVTSGIHPPNLIGCYTSDGASSVLVSSNVPSAICSPKTELREGVMSPNHQISLPESFFPTSSSSPVATSPQPSLTSSSGGEPFIPSLHKRHQSPSLQNLSGSLEDLNNDAEEVNHVQEESGLEKSVLSPDISNNDLQNVIISNVSDPNLPPDSLVSDGHEPDFDSWLHGVETTDEEDARFVRKISEAIRDLDNALALEKTSSSSSALSSKDESPERSRGEQADTKSSDANVVLDFRLGETEMQNSPFLFKNSGSIQPDSFLDESLLEKSLPSDSNNKPGDSGTDTEDEIWRKKIEHGEFTAKVKEKSKSVADLMILTHIDCSDGSDSEPPSLTWSYDRGSNGRNSFTKQLKTNNLSTNPLSFASESNIHQAVLGEEFRDTLLKLHEAQKDQKTSKSMSEEPIQMGSEPTPVEFLTSKSSLQEPSNLLNHNEVCNVNYEIDSSHLTKNSSFLVDDASEKNSYGTLKDPLHTNHSVMPLEESGDKNCDNSSLHCTESKTRNENESSCLGNLSSLILKNDLLTNLSDKINYKTEDLASTVENSGRNLGLSQKYISNEVCYDFLKNEKSYNLNCSPEENQLNSMNENLKGFNNENILCISDTSCRVSSHNKLLNVLCSDSEPQNTYNCNSSEKNFKDDLCTEENPLMIENKNLVEKNDRNIQYSYTESESPTKYGTNMIVNITVGEDQDLSSIKADNFQSCTNIDEICSPLTESSILSKVGSKAGESEGVESSSGSSKIFQSHKEDVGSGLCSSVVNNAVVADGEILNCDNFNISAVSFPLESILQKPQFLKDSSFFKEEEQLSTKITFPTLNLLDDEQEYCVGSQLPDDSPCTESHISSSVNENIHENGLNCSTKDKSFSIVEETENDISNKCNNLQSSSYKSGNKENLCQLELNIKTCDAISPDTVLKTPKSVPSQNLCLENTLHELYNAESTCFVSGEKEIAPMDSSETVHDNIGNLNLKYCDKEVHMKIVESINEKDGSNTKSQEESKNCEGDLLRTILQKENLEKEIVGNSCTVADALVDQDLVCNVKQNSERNLILKQDISDNDIDCEFGVKRQFEFNNPDSVGDSLEVKSNLEGWKRNSTDILNGEFLHSQNHSNISCESHYLNLDTQEDFHSEKSENDGILECEEVEEYGIDVAKHSTPDDERSSDSGFRDKGSLSESCEDACDEKYNLEDIEAELEETFSKNKFCYVVKGLSRDEDHTSSEDIPLELCPDQDITSTASGRDTSPCEISSSVSQTVLEGLLRKENNGEDNESSNVDLEMESFPSETGNVEVRDVGQVKVNNEFHKASPSETPDLLNIETNDMPMPDVTSLHNFKAHSCGCVSDDQLREDNFHCAISNIYCSDVQSNFYQEKDNILDIGQTEFRTASPDQSYLEDSAESSPMKKSGWFLHSQKNVPASESNYNESDFYENMSPISSSSSILNDEDSDSNKFDDYGLPLRLNEEFVTAIRNELQEKLPCARKQTDDDNEDDGVLEPEDELMEDERTNITIHYSGYPPPLSPILEERESVSSITTTLSDNFLAKGDQSHESNSEPMSPVFILDTVDVGTENDSKVFEEDIREALENCSVSSVETDSISEKEHKDKSVIVEDLEKLDINQSSVPGCEHALPENITVFKSTPPVDFDDDFLVIDMETNHATLLESPKPKSHLAFVKNHVPSGFETNPEISRDSCHCKELPVSHTCDQLEECSKESDSEVSHSEATCAAVMSSPSQTMNVPCTNITPVCESSNESVTSSTNKSLMNSADSLNSQPTSDTNSSSFVDPSLITELPSVVQKISIGVVNNEAAEILYELEQSGIIQGATDESTEIQNECNVPIGLPYCTNLTSSDPVKRDSNEDDVSPVATSDNSPCIVKQGPTSETPNALQRPYSSPEMFKNDSVCEPSHSFSVTVHKCPSEEECLSTNRDGEEVIQKRHALLQESVVPEDKDWSEPMLEAAVLSTKAPMPSPEDELWKQIPSMLAFSDLHDMMSRSRSEGDYAESYDVDSPGFQSHDNDEDLMTTSFSLKDSEDVGDCYTPDWESEEDTNEDNSSSSGEFIWKDGDNESFVKAVDIESSGTSKPFEGHSEFAMEMIAEEDEDDEEEDDDDEDDEGSLSTNSGTEFIPSTWDSEATPSRSALRSPEKKEIQKKNVSFKKQKYHCVYEYPREPSDSESDLTDSPQRRQWDLMNFDVDYASYADWELMDGDMAETSEPDVETDPEVSQAQPTHTFDIYKLSSVDCDLNTDSLSGDGEFYISSSARPFQFSAGSSDIFDGNRSEFFPGQLFEDNVTAPLVDLTDVSVEFPPLESAKDDKVCNGRIEKVCLDSGETEICENTSSKENISEIQNHSAHNSFVPSHCFVDGSKTDQVLSADTSDESPSPHDLPQSPMSPTMGLGELRHTRDRLKLDLPASCSTFSLDMPAAVKKRPVETIRGEASLLDSADETENSDLESCNGIKFSNSS